MNNCKLRVGDIVLYKQLGRGFTKSNMATVTGYIYNSPGVLVLAMYKSPYHEIYIDEEEISKVLTKEKHPEYFI